MKKKFDLAVKKKSEDLTKEEWLGMSKRINVDIDENLHHKFDLKCCSNKKTMSQVIREWVLKYVNE